MPMGRCAGCGSVGSARKTQIHVLTCPDYLYRYHDDPATCPDPETEYSRHHTDDSTREARAHHRDQRLQHRFAELDAQQQFQQTRWRTPKHLLDD